jgi:membrane protein YqaA with SNARE-associated domain
MDIATGLSASLVGQYGYWGMSLALILNCLGIPIPSEVTLPLAGLAVEQGHWGLIQTVVMAVASQLVGLIASYWLARRGSEGDTALLHRIPHAHRLKALQDKLAERGVHVVFCYLAATGLTRRRRLCGRARGGAVLAVCHRCFGGGAGVDLGADGARLLRQRPLGCYLLCLP